MGYYASGIGEIRFPSKKDLEAVIEELKKIPASNIFGGIEEDYPDHESFDFCKVMSELGFVTTRSKDDFYPYSFAIEYEWGKIGSWTDEPFKAIGPIASRAISSGVARTVRCGLSPSFIPRRTCSSPASRMVALSARTAACSST